jgi:glycosyltransferase involved in cell wall biosynthesis
MKIALLAHALRGQGGLLIGHSFMGSLAESAPQHEYLITVPTGCGYEDIALPEGSKFHFCENKDSNTAFFSRVRIEFREVPAILKAFNPDVVFNMQNHGLRKVRCPQAIWIQNGYLVYPSKHFGNILLKERLQVKLQRAYLRSTLKHADLLFCQTPVMRQRTADYYNYNISKIKVLPNTLSTFLQEPKIGKPPAMLKELQDEKFKCLILSQYYPHKNPEMVLDACLSSDRCLDDVVFITTLSEQQNVHSRHFLRRLDKNPHLKKLIRNIGPIPHEELESYYRHVQLVVMPTLMESFSITYMEAMHFGVPILTTDIDFAHYLCGDAAAYYNPWQPESLVDKLLILKAHASERKKLVDEGHKQLRKFSSTWNDIVKKAISEVEHLVE